MKVERKFSTKLNKDAVSAIETVATLDFSGVKPEEMVDLACRPVIILQQAIYRESGKIPETDTVDVRKLLDTPRGGFKVTPESTAARINKMPVEEYRATLALMGLSEREVEKMVNKKFPPVKAA